MCLWRQWLHGFNIRGSLQMQSPLAELWTGAVTIREGLLSVSRSARNVLIGQGWLKSMNVSADVHEPLFHSTITMQTGTALHANNLLQAASANKLCKAFGIKVSPHTHIVQLAKNAGFESLFIDLEHAWLSLEQTTALCHVGLLAGISPFVRVPHKCGNGFVQRVLDGGAMGVIFPHIHSAGKQSLSFYTRFYATHLNICLCRGR